MLRESIWGGEAHHQATTFLTVKSVNLSSKSVQRKSEN